MKKSILIIISLFIFCCCGYDKDYVTTITYNVYYPNKIVKKEYIYHSSDEPSYSLYSNRGSNTLHIYENDSWGCARGRVIESTTAPIEVISFTKRKK